MSAVSTERRVGADGEDVDFYVFRGHMSLDPEQGCKFTINVPRGAAAGARIMAVEFAVPKSVFETPQLKAVVTVSEAQARELVIDTAASATALEAVVGAQISVTVSEPGGAQ